MPKDTMPSIAQSDTEHAFESLVRETGGDQCSVLLHNDDVTPYDYVTGLLGDLFMLSGELAEHIAVTAHTRGAAVVAVRPRTEAEKLVKIAHGRARREGFPLTFSLEQE